MPATVEVNDLTLAHKGTGGYARSTLPDVCKTPTVPVPYTNVSFISTLTKGTQTVFADGNEIAIKGSEQATSIGDEPGVGEGVKSGTQLNRATWLSWSPNVFIEGSPANRLTDKMLMNNGNTVCLAGHWDPPLQDKGPKAKELCKEACECKIQEDNNQDAAEKKDEPYRRKDDDCFKKRLRLKGYENNRPTPDTVENGRLSNPVYLKNDGTWELVYSKTPGCEGLLTNGRPAGSEIPDCVYTQGGQTQYVYEMKFGEDRLQSNQRENQVEIAGDGEWHDINVDEDCDCDGYKKQKEADAKAATAKAALERMNQLAVLAAAVRYLAVREAEGPVGDLLILWDMAKAVFTISPAY